MSARRVLRAGGLWFNGYSSYAIVPHSDTLENPSYTLIVWMRCYDYWTKNWFGIVTKNRDDTEWYTQVYGIWAAYYKLHFRSGTNYVNIPFSDTANFHILALQVVGGGTANAWIDGEVKGSFTDNRVKGTRPLYIGLAGGTKEYFNGIVAKVVMYNRTLSNDEIRAIYERDELIRDGLVLHLDFSEGEGGIAYDKSGCGNHATIYGARWVIKKPLRVLQR